MGKIRRIDTTQLEPRQVKASYTMVDWKALM